MNFIKIYKQTSLNTTAYLVVKSSDQRLILKSQIKREEW